MTVRFPVARPSRLESESVEGPLTESVTVMITALEPPPASQPEAETRTHVSASDSPSLAGPGPPARTVTVAVPGPVTASR